MHEQAIDETSADEVIEAGYSADAADRARQTVESLEQFIEEHRDEITALQILYARPHRQRLTFAQIKELAQAIGRPPHQWTPETALAGVRAARPLEGARLRRARAHRPRLARARRAPPGGRARPVPRPRRASATTPGSSSRRTPAASSRPSSSPGSSASATTIAAVARDHAPTTSATRRSSRRRARQGAQVFGDELDPLLDEINEVLAA